MRNLYKLLPPALRQGSLLADQDGLGRARRRQAESAPAQYNDRPDEQRYPFVIVQCPRTGRFRHPRSACTYPARLVSAVIRTMSRIRVFFRIQPYRLLGQRRLRRGSSSSSSSSYSSGACGIGVAVGSDRGWDGGGRRPGRNAGTSRVLPRHGAS
jgi:hypothetical protein